MAPNITRVSRYCVRGPKKSRESDRGRTDRACFREVASHAHNLRSTDINNCISYSVDYFGLSGVVRSTMSFKTERTICKKHDEIYKPMERSLFRQ